MKKVMLSFMLGAILFGTAGVHAAGGNMIEVFYNIKDIKINKVSEMPSEKPFTYKGTTYVPLRYVSEKLGVDVRWEGPKQTVHIGEMENSNFAYPGRDFEHMNYQRYIGSIDYQYNSSSQISDNIGNKYSSYIKSYLYGNGNDGSPWNKIEYPLNGKFKSFKASYGITSNSRDEDFNGGRLEIYLDDNKSQEYSIKPGEAPIDININVANVNKISFKFIAYSSYSNNSVETALFDAYFTK